MAATRKQDDGVCIAVKGDERKPLAIPFSTEAENGWCLAGGELALFVSHQEGNAGAMRRLISQGFVL